MSQRTRFRSSSVGTKLGLIVLTLTGIVGLLLQLLIAEKDIAIAFAQREQAGNRLLTPLAEARAANHRLRRAREPQAYQQAHGELKRALALLPRQGVVAPAALPSDPREREAGYQARARQLQSLNRQIGDTSNLILDPDLDSYYLMDLVLLHLPEEQLQLSHVLVALERGQTPSAELQLLRDGLDGQRRSMQVASANNPLGNLAPTLAPRFAKKLEREVAFLSAVERLGSQSSPAARQAVLAQGEQVLQESLQVGQLASRELGFLLAERIEGHERRKWSALLLVAVVLIVALLCSFALIRQLSSVLRRVAERVELLRSREITRLESGIVALAEGVRDVPLTLEGDAVEPLPVPQEEELGSLSLSVNQLAGQARVTLTALSTTQEALARAERALRESEEQLRHQAFHDPLTQLPNRAFFLAQLDHALIRAQRMGSWVSVLFLDMDNFKVVNDSLGHEAGDALLKEMAGRLVASVRPSDLVARIGGDEFLILLEEVANEETAFGIAERLCNALEQPFSLLGNEVASGASIGVAFCQAGQLSASELVRDADIAMYRAKGEGKHRYVAFDASMNVAAQQRMDLEADLRRVLAREIELCLYFQPIYSLDSGEFAEVEALVRWNHHRHGMILPDQFISVAEETGLILPLGDWVLRKACTYAQEWRFPVSINVSLRQLQQDNIVERVRAILQETGAPPELIKLEVTETLMVDEPAKIASRLAALKGLGVQLALDDFGVGYSSMAYLRDMPIDTLKIDRSFIRRLGQSEEDEAIVVAMVHLAQALRLTIVCEGIETEPQQLCLQRLNCQFGQGFLYSPPRSAEEIVHLIPRRDALPLAA